MERVPRAVDDGLQQLVPRARRRRQPRDVADEPELLELRPGRHRVRGARARCAGLAARGYMHARVSLYHVHHPTRVGTVAPQKGCDPVAPRLRYRPPQRGAG